MLSRRRYRGALGARAPRGRKKGEREEEEREKKEGEIMLVSYYNLNNEVFAICSERKNVMIMSPSQMIQNTNIFEREWPY